MQMTRLERTQQHYLIFENSQQNKTQFGLNKTNIQFRTTWEKPAAIRTTKLRTKPYPILTLQFKGVDLGIHRQKQLNHQTNKTI